VIVRLLGQGGMGAVYEAEDSLLGRRVALKLIPTCATAEVRERMRREARTAALLEHPNVVLVYDVGDVEDGSDAGETFLAMELVRGRTLRSIVYDQDVSIGKKLRWLIEVARALDAAHAAGLVHRDVKPDNLMVRDDGVVKVLDFGIAKKSSTVDPLAPTGVSPDPLTLTQAGSIVGTPMYASPEQLRGESLDGGADQYSWGVTAYELLAGRAPFETDDPIALLSRVLSSDPPKLRELDPAIPADVESAVHRAMGKRRADRFARLEDAAVALEPFADAPLASGERRSALSDAPVSTPQPYVVTRTARATARVLLWIAAGLGSLCVVAIVLGVARGHRLRTSAQNVEQPTPAAAGPAPRALRCADARVSGSGAPPELAHMMGIGACARLAVAVGVPWTHDKAVDRGVTAEGSPLDVVVDLADRTRVRLSLGKEQSTAESGSPIEAMHAAVVSLAARIPVAPMTAAERADWGATNDESGRRIERMWRRLLMGDLKDGEGDAKALVAADPDSPWPYAILAFVGTQGTKTSLDAVHAMEARLDRLSSARRKGLRALARLADKPDPNEALRELRRAYNDAPDDADMAALYATVAASLVTSDEGFAIVDRLSDAFPTHSLLALMTAITAPSRADLERDSRYVARLIDVFPEARCGLRRIDHLIAKDKLAEARASARGECARFFGTAIGDYGLGLLQGMAELDMATQEFDAVHDLAVKWMGDPRPTVRNGAAAFVIRSYLAAGRIAEGEETLKGELARQRDQESPLIAIQHALTILQIHRRLGTPAPAEVVAWLAKTSDEATWLANSQKLAVAVPIALARRNRREMDDLLSRIEQAGDPNVEIAALPLVRARKGNKAAVELWRRRQRAPDGAWHGSDIDAALALAAIHADSSEIREALRLVTRPGQIGFDTAVAEAILARVYTAEGKQDEAARVAKSLEKRLSKADKGVAEAVAKAR
jgi:hypothetical protein